MQRTSQLDTSGIPFLQDLAADHKTIPLFPASYSPGPQVRLQSSDTSGGYVATRDSWLQFIKHLISFGRTSWHSFYGSQSVMPVIRVTALGEPRKELPAHLYCPSPDTVYQSGQFFTFIRSPGKWCCEVYQNWMFRLNGKQFYHACNHSPANVDDNFWQNIWLNWKESEWQTDRKSYENLSSLLAMQFCSLTQTDNERAIIRSSDAWQHAHQILTVFPSKRRKR